MRALPRRAALFCGGCLGQVGWLTGLKRGLVLDNLRQALPEKDEGERRRIAARSARNFARTITEFVRLDGPDRHSIGQLVDLEGAERIEEAMEEGRGCLVLTAHLGAWVMYFAALSERGIPISLLVGKQHNRRVDAFIQSMPGDEVTLIPKGRSAVKRILQALEQGRCIVMVADQHAGPGGIVSPFLGREASTLSLPGAFVARNRVPVFTMAGRREAEGRHVAEIEPLRFAESDSRETVKREVTDAYNRAIGQAVLRHPDQYFWYHRRWRESDA